MNSLQAQDCSRWRIWLPAIVAAAGVLLASWHLTDEGAGSLDGDMPRYLMNGLFLRDVLHDLPIRAPLEYAEHYFARYPALSLGHHPLLPAIAEIPFFSLFGISLVAARASSLAALAMGLYFWCRLVQEIYDGRTAIFASLLLISSPGVLLLYQVVLSEPLTLSCIIASVYYMHRYCKDKRRRDLVAFAVAVVLSAYAKHLAVLMAPVYVFQFVRRFGLRSLFRRSSLMVTGVIILCVLPLVPLTLKYSHFNLLIVSQFIPAESRWANFRLLRFVEQFWTGQFRMTVPALLLAAVSVAGAARHRDRRALTFVIWVASLYAGLLALGVANDRFMCYWLPAFCALAAAGFHVARGRAWQVTWALLLTATLGYQAWLYADDVNRSYIGAARPAGVAGYEEAARIVTGQPLGETVLYSAAVDTGYFVFFVRKHDVQRDMVILRADKLLTTSRMGRLDFQRRIRSQEEILPILNHFGVGYVVIEDVTYPRGPLRWLQETVQQSDAFVLARRIPIDSIDLRLKGASISVYQYRHHTPAAPNAALSIDVPLMDGSLEVPLTELTSRHVE